MQCGAWCWLDKVSVNIRAWRRSSTIVPNSCSFDAFFSTSWCCGSLSSIHRVVDGDVVQENYTSSSISLLQLIHNTMRSHIPMVSLRRAHNDDDDDTRFFKYSRIFGYQPHKAHPFLRVEFEEEKCSSSTKRIHFRCVEMKSAFGSAARATSAPISRCVYCMVGSCQKILVIFFSVGAPPPPQLRAHAECHQQTTAIQKKNEIDHKVLGFVRQIDVNQITNYMCELWCMCEAGLDCEIHYIVYAT